MSESDRTNASYEGHRPSDSAEKRIPDSESRFRNTVKQAPVGIAILQGHDFVVEMANESYLLTVDRTEEQMLHKSLFESLPEVKGFVEPILREVLQSGNPFYGNEFEVTLVRSGQPQQCYFNFVYQPFYEETGELTGIIVVATEVTQQVIAKHSLERSENQFRNLVTQSQFAKAIFKGPEFVISIANETMLKTLWRRNLHEVIGKKLVDVFPELKEQKFIDILNEVFTTGTTYRENEALAYIDGPGGSKTHYLDYQYAPMFEIDGSVSGIMVSVNDVTEKVRFRQQIAEAAERLSLATEGTQLATWDLNLETMDMIYSGRMAVIFGFPETSMFTHAAFRERLHPDDRKNIVEKAFEVALETGAYFYDARIIHPDNSLHWIRTQGKVYYRDGKPYRMLGTMIDITDRKEAELALKTSEGKFRTLSDSMPQFIWTGDANGVINYFNKAVYDYTGIALGTTPEDIWTKIIHEEDLGETIRLWQDAVENGHSFHLDHRWKNSSGAFRWQASQAIPQKNPDGSVQMWVGTSTDVHDSKLFIDQLEMKVQMRTAELTIANSELQRTNMELAQFAYVASHDLQEPLRKIQTFATRILETETANLSEKGRDYFVRMQSSSTRMQRLIVDLLAFSRANVVEKHFELTDLNVVMRSVKEQLADQIMQTGAVIHQDELPVRSVIVYQFEQLFMNLIANALKFTRKGIPPVIHIRAGKVSGDLIPAATADPRLFYEYISFSDNGIGFDPQFKDRIFQVFQRLHNRSAYEGTGIGLAICKKIMENHKGFIDAVGKPGAGSTFVIYLPGKSIR